MEYFVPDKNQYFLNQRQISKLLGKPKRTVSRKLQDSSYSKIKNTYYYNLFEVKKMIKKYYPEYIIHFPQILQFVTYQRNSRLKDQLVLQLAFLLQFFCDEIKLFDLHSYEFLVQDLEKVSGKKCNNFVDYENKYKFIYELNQLKKTFSKIKNYEGVGAYINYFSQLEALGENFESDTRDFIYKFNVNDMISVERGCGRKNLKLRDCFDLHNSGGALGIFSVESDPVYHDLSFNFLVVEDRSLVESTRLLKDRKIDGIIDCTKGGLFKHFSERKFPYFHFYPQDLNCQGGSVSMEDFFFEIQKRNNTTFNQLSDLVRFILSVVN